jgi:hypothetical protein
VRDVGGIQCAWLASAWPLASRDPVHIPLRGCGLGLQGRHHPIDAALDLATRMQQVPHIAAMLPRRIDRGTRLLHGWCAITDGGMPAQAACLRLPQDQGPGVGVDGQRAFGRPDRPTVEIDDIEIGPRRLRP